MRAILLLIAAILAGCSADESLVTIKFQIAGKEKLLLDRWQNNLLSSRAPTSVVDFTCFAVNVVGPGIPSMKPNDFPDFPGLLNGNVCTYPGPSSTLVANNESGSVMEVRVPVGKDRLIQVAGLINSDGCDMKPPFANILLGRRVGDPNLSGFTDIYEVGRKVIELTPGDNDRTLTIASNFSTSNDMLNCSSSTGTGSGQTGTLALSPSVAAIHRAGTFPLHRTGGTAPFSYTASCPGSSCTVESGLFKPPNVSAGAPPSSGLVTVTDGTGASATANFTVYNPAAAQGPVLWFIADAFNSSPTAEPGRDFQIPVGQEDWSNFSPVTPQLITTVTPPPGFGGIAGIFDNLLFALPSVTFSGHLLGYFFQGTPTSTTISANTTILVVSKLASPAGSVVPSVCFAAINVLTAECAAGYDHLLLAYDSTTGKFFGRTEKTLTQSRIDVPAVGSIGDFRIHQLTLGSTTSSYTITGHAKVSGGSFTGFSAAPGSKFYIGGSGVATAPTFKGAIAEVMIFSGIAPSPIAAAVTYLSKKYGIAEPPAP